MDIISRIMGGDWNNFIGGMIFRNMGEDEGRDLRIQVGI